MAKKQNENCAINIAHNPLVEGRQLELLVSLGKRHKPQISSIPGIPPKQHDRYRVMLDDEILGDHLSIDQALVLSKSLNSNLNNPLNS